MGWLPLVGRCGLVAFGRLLWLGCKGWLLYVSQCRSVAVGVTVGCVGCLLCVRRCELVAVSISHRRSVAMVLLL